MLKLWALVSEIIPNGGASKQQDIKIDGKNKDGSKSNTHSLD